LLLANFMREFGKTHQFDYQPQAGGGDTFGAGWGYGKGGKGKGSMGYQGKGKGGLGPGGAPQKWSCFACGFQDNWKTFDTCKICCLEWTYKGPRINVGSSTAGGAKGDGKAAKIGDGSVPGAYKHGKNTVVPGLDSYVDVVRGGKPPFKAPWKQQGRNGPPGEGKEEGVGPAGSQEDQEDAAKIGKRLAKMQEAIRSIKNCMEFSVGKEGDVFSTYLGDLQSMSSGLADKLKEAKRSGFSAEVNIQKCTERIGRLDKVKLKLQEESGGLEKLIEASKLKQEANSKRIEEITHEIEQEHIQKKEYVTELAKEEGMGSDLEEEGEDEEGEEDRNMGGAASEGGGAKDAKKNTKSLSKYILKDMQVPALAKLIVEQINPQGSQEANALVGALQGFITKSKVRGWNPQTGSFGEDPGVSDLVAQLRASLTKGFGDAVPGPEGTEAVPQQQRESLDLLDKLQGFCRARNGTAGAGSRSGPFS
jgi:hypothetical protein